jgi:hypothetical protein
MGYLTRGRQQAVQMGTIRASMDIGRNVTYVMKLRSLKWLHTKRMARNTRSWRRILEWVPEGKSKKGTPPPPKIKSWINRVIRSMTDNGQTEQRIAHRGYVDSICLVRRKTT